MSAGLQVPLKNTDKVAIIDLEDLKMVSGLNWRLGNGYAACSFKTDNGFRRVYMHRLILEAPEGKEVDHKNMDRLDNRRENIRLCSRAENKWNENPSKKNKSGYRGISWFTRDGKWQVMLRHLGNRIFLGRYFDIKEAVKVYNSFISQHRGDFAKEIIV